MKPIVLCLSLVLVACGGTERTRRTFPVSVGRVAEPLMTDSGWSISLTRATVHFESLRFFEGEVLLARAAPWWRGLLVGDAWAHPGHYIPGEALGELVQPIDVDLLADPVPWGTANAVTGKYGSAQLTLGAAGLELAGVATKGGQSVDFSTAFLPPAALEGVRFDHLMTTATGTVDVRVSLAVVLSRVDFAQVGSSAKPLDSMSPAYNGVGRGVEDTSAYALTWLEN